MTFFAGEHNSTGKSALFHTLICHLLSRMPKCLRKFDQNGMTHVFCKSNVDGQHSAEACFKCRQAFGIIRSSKDAAPIARTIANLKSWTDGMCKNRNCSDDLPFWKSEEEKSFLSKNVKTFLSEEDRSCRPREQLGEVTPALLDQHVNLQLPLSL